MLWDLEHILKDRSEEVNFNICDASGALSTVGVGQFKTPFDMLYENL